MSTRQKIILIFAPPYDPLSGGVVALHKLCHLINDLGREAFLLPNFPGMRLDYGSTEQRAENLNKTIIFQDLYARNPTFNTPIVRPELYENLHVVGDVVAVYPEIIFGNPLNARHVARWLLHNPGFFTRAVYYHTGELYFRYGKETVPAVIPGSKVSETILEITHYPLELYNLKGASTKRSGTAYCLRKGRHKEIRHDLSNSILIDGKSHEEVAFILKRVNQFISYDARTAYSKLALLCGCESIVIPDEGASIDDWQPDPWARAGIAYGFENLEQARGEAHLAPEFFAQREAVSREAVKSFLSEIDYYFSDV